MLKRWVLNLAASLARRLPPRTVQRLYRWRALAGFIRRWLNRAAPDGLVEIQVAAGGLQGMRLTLDLHCEKDYWLGTYEPELQAALRHFVQPGMVAFDLGANIGYISLLLARQVGVHGKVFAFEALPENQERLRTHVTMNGFEALIQVIPMAVVDRPGTVRFLLGPSHGMGKVAGSAGRQEIGYKEEIEVEGISLDSFVFEGGHPPPQVIKMDIEGGEVLAIAGMTRLLRMHPPLIFLELHGQEAAQAVWQALSAHAYRLCRMHPPYPVVAALGELDWKAYLVALPPGVDDLRSVA